VVSDLPSETSVLSSHSYWEGDTNSLQSLAPEAACEAVCILWLANMAFACTGDISEEPNGMNCKLKPSSSLCPAGGSHPLG
jgi:hypothetical protein